jgi:hypothetical protein
VRIEIGDKMHIGNWWGKNRKKETLKWFRKCMEFRILPDTLLACDSRNLGIIS